MYRFLLYIILSIVYISNIHAQSPQIIKGEIDLSSVNFKENITIALEGEWEFYWNKLYTPQDIPQLQFDSIRYLTFPSIWNDYEDLQAEGVATYRLKVTIDSTQQLLGIKIPKTFCCHNLWINDKLISVDGVVADNKEDAVPKSIPYSKAIKVDTSTFYITFQTANYFHYKGGIESPIEIGNADNILQDHQNSLNYTLILSGCLVMGGLFFLGLFLFGRRDYAMLYFALLCLVLSLREVNTNLYFIYYLFEDLNWHVLRKLEYMTIYIPIIVFSEFVRILYPDEVKRWLVRFAQIISGVMVLLTLLTSIKIYAVVNNYYLIALLPFFPALAFYVFKAFLNNRLGAHFAVFGLISIIISTFLNILSHFEILGSVLLPQFILYILFILSLSLILAYRYSHRLKVAADRADIGARSKSEFLATMSHEIRTPMNGVLGMTNLLAQTKLNQEQSSYLNSIKESGVNLLSIIDDILDYSKIDSGNMVLEKRSFNLENLLEELTDAFTTSINDKNLGFYILTDPTIPKSLIGDVNRLKQVLYNLLNNAVKFTEQGSIFLYIKQLASHDGSISLEFEVKDTGIGIEEDKIEGLFKQFQQLDGTLSRRFGGTGLGLAICKQLVTLMGGDIKAISMKDVGTSIIFNLDFKVDTEQLKSFKFDIIEEVKDKVAFVIGHSYGLKNFLKHHLEEQQMHLQYFQTYQDAASYLLIKNVDLIIIEDSEYLDANKVAHHIRKMRKHRVTNILLLLPPTRIKKLHSPNSYAIATPLKSTTFRHTLKNIFLDNFVEPSEQLDKQMAEQPHDLKILIAEDHAINQQLVLFILKKLGFAADIVNNGYEVLEAVADKPYDLIFMDVQMPNMDGLEATRRIVRAYPKNQRPAIVAMTANTSPDEVKACFDAGMNDYVPKPLKDGIVKEMISKWAMVNNN